MKLSDLTGRLRLRERAQAAEAWKERLFPTRDGVPVRGAQVEPDEWAARREAERTAPRENGVPVPQPADPTRTRPLPWAAGPVEAPPARRSDAAPDAAAPGESIEPVVFSRPAPPAAPQGSEGSPAPGKGAATEDGETDSAEGTGTPRRPAPRRRRRHSARDDLRYMLWSAAIVLGLLGTAVAFFCAALS